LLILIITLSGLSHLTRSMLLLHLRSHLHPCWRLQIQGSRWHLGYLRLSLLSPLGPSTLLYLCSRCSLFGQLWTH
jgi:hypothetical protein